MKNYNVTLLLVVNASRDIDEATPELKRVEYIVSANSETEARSFAREHYNDGLSVWESWAYEN